MVPPFKTNSAVAPLPLPPRRLIFVLESYPVPPALNVTAVTCPPLTVAAPFAPVPLAVVSRRRPELAPTGTWAVTVVPFTTLKEPGSSALRLKTSSVELAKFSPLIVTVVPDRPFVGSKELITGNASCARPSKTDPTNSKKAIGRIRPKR